MTVGAQAATMRNAIFPTRQQMFYKGSVTVPVTHCAE